MAQAEDLVAVGLQKISAKRSTTLPMSLAELKTGDAIMLSSTPGSDPGRVTAVMLLAGVEPLLAADASLDD